MNSVLPVSSVPSKLAGIVTHAATAYVVLALGIILSAGFAYWTENQVKRAATAKFDDTVADAHFAIKTRIQAYSEVLLGIKGLFIASDSVTRARFRDYIGILDLNRRYPGIQVIHYGQRIAASQRRAFETMVRNDTSVNPGGYPDFSIKPPGDRPEYVVVQYVEPMAGNEVALGLDLGGDAVRLAALERTRDSGEVTASGSIALALDPSRHPGFAMRLPIYQKNMPVATVAQRRDAFTGMVSASFIVIDLMRGVLSEPVLQSLHVRIHDAGFLNAPDGLRPPTPENLMFDSNRLRKPAFPQLVTNEGRPTGMTSASGLDVGGRRWNIYFNAQQDFVAASDYWLPVFVLLSGAIISLLLFGMIRSLATTGGRAVALAASITEELRDSETSLAAAQRMTQELIEVLPNPIFFKNTDGRYLGVNRAWETFFGVARETFIGKTVHDLYPNNPDVADRLHAMDQLLWNKPGIQEYETTITTPDGERHDTIYFKATFTRADGSVAGLIGTIVDITERKQAEAARIQLAAIVENSNDAIFSRTLDGTILSWNAGAERMLGYTAAEAIGKPVTFTLPPDRPPRLAQNNEQVLGGGVVTGETDRMTKDGRLINVLSSHSLIKDSAGNIVGASVILHDITALKQAQSAVRESEARFRATFDQAAVGIAHFDLQNRNIKVNRRYSEIVGYTPAELIGKAPGFLNHPDDAGVGNEQRRLLRAGAIDHFSQEKRYIRKDGTVIWVRRTESLARDDAGAPQYYIRVIEDITERKQAEVARASLEAQLRESQKMEAIGTLAGGIAHDFNNMIATILGNAELARQDVGDSPLAQESLDEIRKACARARDLVQQILSFSRRQPTDRKPTELALIIDESARLLRATLPARVTIETHCESAVPAVLIDATQLQQVLINLATNAMQAMQGEPGRINIRLDSVMLDAAMASENPALRVMHGKHPGRTVRLTVNDNGAGMDKTTRERIFEPFFTTKAVNEGTGLGLSVVHGIVQAHEGAIVVESDPGKGATFKIYLPAAAPAPSAFAPGESEAGAAAAPARSADSRQHVLYLDDDKSLAFLVQRLLERWGYRVSVHTNQNEALAALRADPAAFDLVVTDYNMPGMSGLDVARAVRTIRADLPVAVASGFIDETLSAKAEDAGVRELIFKASSVEKLCEAYARLAQSARETPKAS